MYVCIYTLMSGGPIGYWFDYVCMYVCMYVLNLIIHTYIHTHPRLHIFIHTYTCCLFVGESFTYLHTY